MACSALSKMDGTESDGLPSGSEGPLPPSEPSPERLLQEAVEQTGVDPPVLRYDG